MFTFRYESHPQRDIDAHPGAPPRQPADSVQHTHSVMSGESYRVEFDNASNRKVITISKPLSLIDNSSDADNYILYVGPREPLSVVYVMNAAGRTIDTIR